MAPTISNFSQQNKVVILTDAATITPNSDTMQLGVLLSLSQTSVIANPTGTPRNGQMIQIRISSTISRAISFGTLYQSTSRLLPTMTTGGGIEDYVEFKYNTLDVKWDLTNTTINTFKISRNYFKNPNFAVQQSTVTGIVANSLALPTASLGYLGETEWWLTASGNGGAPTYAFSQANENVTFTGASGTIALYLGQRIEARDANRLKNKTVTISAEISNSLLTSVTWELFNPTTSNDTHGTVATPTQTLIATGTFTVTATSARYSATIALPVGVTRGLEVRLRVGAQISGTWVVSRLQLEEGSIANIFACDDYVIELQKCQRFAQKVMNGLESPAIGRTYVEKAFKTAMFGTPVLTNLVAGTATNATITFESALDNENIGFEISATVVNGTVAGRVSLCSAHIP